MEGYVLVILVVIGAPLVWAIWLSARAVSARERIEELTARLARLESEVRELRRAQETEPAETHAAPGYAPKQIYEPQPEPEPPVFEPPPFTKPIFQPGQTAPPPITPPLEQPIPPLIAQPQPSAPLPPKPSPVWKPAFDWEQFMGVRLFAWAGGLALFLGIAFFIKYSFERNWFPPELRVALGFVAGLAALVVGVVMASGR